MKLKVELGVNGLLNPIGNKVNSNFSWQIKMIDEEKLKSFQCNVPLP